MNGRYRKLIKSIPLLLTGIMVTICVVFLVNHDFKELLNYTPGNLYLAGFVLIGFYAVKSLSVVFPLTALFVTCGAIYPFWIAVMVNIIGLSVCFTIPYMIGRISGSPLMETIEEKYPKARKLVNYGQENNLFASYISRAVVFVPGDVVSMIHGAVKMPYKPYLLGSLLGVMPEMLVQTYIGDQLSTLTVKSAVIMVLLILLTLLFSLLINKRVSRRKSENNA